MVTTATAPERKVSAAEAREVAEAAREQEWVAPSFVRDLFLGKFRLDLIHPYPVQIRYPEGWLQRGNGKTVTFQDKNNRIRIVVSSGAAFTAGSVRADIAALKSSNSSFTATTPTPVVLPAGPAFKVSYSTDSAPNPVTNKRVTLAVDRYYISKGGKRAIIDLGAPKGVDNVDAFRMISRSFRWR